MAVTLDNLSCKFYRRDAELFASDFFNTRVNVGISADCTGEFTNGNDFFSAFYAFDIAAYFVIPQSEFQTESHRFGMNAVRAADANGVFVFFRLTQQNVAQFFEVIQDDFGGFFIIMPSAVSFTSLEVNPLWMYLESSPTYSATLVKNAIIS